MMTDNTVAVEALAARRLDLKAQLEAIEADLKAVDAALLTLLEPGDVATFRGEPVWVVQRGAHRWNEAKAREVLPEVLIDAITVTKTTLDAKLAKAKLPPELYDSACVEGAPTIRAAK